MSGVKWIRLDTSIFDNPKFLYLKEEKQFRAIVAHIEAMCYSGRHGLAGFVPRAALRGLGLARKDAEKLVSEHLWTPAPGGYQINDWNDYQLTSEEIENRRKRAQTAAATRWNSNRWPDA
jgi:hypothetical protein